MMFHSTMHGSLVRPIANSEQLYQISACMWRYLTRLTSAGLTVGTWHLGCIVSAITTIFVGDLLGRRRTLILGLTFWVIGEIIQTSSYSFPQFIVGRAVAGFGKQLFCLSDDEC